MSRRIARIVKERMEGERLRGFEGTIGPYRRRHILHQGVVEVVHALIGHGLQHQRSPEVDQRIDEVGPYPATREVRIVTTKRRSQGETRAVVCHQLLQRLDSVQYHLIDAHPHAVPHLLENARHSAPQDHDGTNVAHLHPGNEV